MDRKRTALGIAAVGTATGVVGLVLLATPAGAGAAPPALPQITPEALVQSVLDAEVPAMAGTVEMTNELGLPIPGLPSADGHVARVFTDGDGRFRLALEDRHSGERTIIADGENTWLWDTADRSVTKFDGMDHEGVGHGGKDAAPADRLADPATAARELVELMRADSTLTIDGTARVADRPVYQLVLTPKPTERTLLREVRVAVDEATRLPLRLEVLANGQAEPALSIGFADFDPGAQDPNLFRFTPPEGTTVTEGEDKTAKPAEGDAFFDGVDLKVVGEGWDTVLVGQVPAQALSTPMGAEGGESANASALLERIGTPVSGAFGDGFAITTKVGTALVTTDGRFALGAVPQQVLAEALAAK